MRGWGVGADIQAPEPEPVENEAAENADDEAVPPKERSAHGIALGALRCRDHDCGGGESPGGGLKGFCVRATSRHQSRWKA